MKRFNKFLALLLALVLTVGLLPAAVSAAEYSRVILDEDFENATSLPFTSGDLTLSHVVYYNSGEATITDGAVKLTATEHNNADWHLSDWGMGKVQIQIPGSKFEVGATYTVRAKYKSSHPTTSNGNAGVRATITVQDNPYSKNIIVQNVFIGQEWTVLEYTFVMTEDLSAKGVLFKFGSDYYLPADTTEDTYQDYYLLVDDISITKFVPYGYQSVVDELAAGNAVLQTDVDGTGNDLVLKSGSTLDLAGYTLTVDSLAALKGANVIDSVGGGKLVAYDGVSLDKGNTYVPVKDGSGYVFYQAFANTSEKAGLTAGVNSLSYADKPTLKTNEQGENVANALFANGAADNGISLVYRLSWTVEGKTVTMDVAFSDADIIAAHTLNAENQYSLIRLNATNVVDGATVSTVLVSDLGVEYVVNTATYTAVTE